MYTKLNQKKIVKMIILTILIIKMFSIISFAESAISQEINKFSNKENVSISDFKEFRQEQENKGYEIFILDLQEGFTIPNLIQDENINKIKELVGRESNISLKTINEDTYPKLFNQYNVEFLKCKDDKNFLFFIKSNLVELKVKSSSDNIEVSVDGNLPVKVSEESIQLKKGYIYNITVYKDGNEKTSEVVDLTNYKKDVYELEISGSILPIVFVCVILVVIVSINRRNIVRKIQELLVKLKGVNTDTEVRDSQEEVKDGNMDAEIQDISVPIKYISIGTEIISEAQLIEHERYEGIFEVEVIRKLEDNLDTTKSKLNLVRNKTFEISSNAYNLSKLSRIQLDEIKDDSDEINSVLEQIQRRIDTLKRDIISIKKEPIEKKIDKIKLAVKTTKNIQLGLYNCYLKLDKIQSKQYYIKADRSKSISLYEESIYIYQSYIDIINENSKKLEILIDHIIRSDKQMTDLKEFIRNEMKDMYNITNNVYSQMENQVSTMCDGIKKHNININNALNSLDTNVINILNKEIISINHKLQNINDKADNSNRGVVILKEELTEERNKTIEIKLNALEKIVPVIVDRLNTEYNGDKEFYLCNQYKEKLDEESIGYLRSGEQLYNDYKDAKRKLDDYSGVYIMYSKLLEAELVKCIDYKYLHNTNNKSLGKYINWLRKNKYNIWNNFIDDLIKDNIKFARNNSAHPGIIKLKDVEKIRAFLFKKTESNNMCWIDFILKQQM